MISKYTASLYSSGQRTEKEYPLSWGMMSTTPKNIYLVAKTMCTWEHSMLSGESQVIPGQRTRCLEASQFKPNFRGTG